MITERAIERVLDSVDIVEVIGQFVDLKKAGNSWKGKSPFTEEKTPSFFVVPHKNIFKCFSSGMGGDVVKFLMEKERLSYPETIKWLADKYRVTLEFTDEEPDPGAADKKKEAELLLLACQKRFVEQVSTDLPSKILKDRGITQDDILQWGLGYAPDDFRFLSDHIVNAGKWAIATELGIVRTKGEKNYDAIVNRITFPIVSHQKKLLGFAGRYVGDKDKIAKYINPNESFFYDKSKVLYGLNFAKEAIMERKCAFVVEGYTDVISMHRAGFTNTVATCGTSITPGQIKLLKNYCSTVMLFQDGDNAGQRSTQRAIPMFLKAGFLVYVVIGAEGQDPDDLIRSSSGKQAEEAIADCMDAVYLRCEQLLCSDLEPHEAQTAFDQVCEILVCVPGEIARNKYIEGICSKHGLKKTNINRGVRMLIEAENSKKGTVEDALPQDIDEADFFKYGFYEKEGKYWSINLKGIPVVVTNFTMKILYHVNTGEDLAYRFIALKSIHGLSKDLLINTDDFESVGAFRKTISRLGNFLFKGSDVDLMRLKDKLQRSELHTKFVKCLGYNTSGKFYAWANGVVVDDQQNGQDFLPVDEHGIVSVENQSYFIPAGSSMSASKEELFASYKKFAYTPNSNSDLNQWWGLFHQVYGKPAIIGLAFLFASLYRDIIFKRIRRFPLLNLYGQRGSGKGTFAESILAFGGKPQEPLMLGGSSTPVAYMRSFAQFSNWIVWLDEYKNSLHPKHIESIKNVFDGIGYKRGKRDHSFEVDYVPVSSTCILSGQEMPTIEPALFTRVVLLSFSQKSSPSESQRLMLKQLKQLELDGLTHLTVELLSHRQLMESDYEESFYEVMDTVREKIGDQVEERMIYSIASLGGALKILLSKISIDLSFQDFIDYACKNALVQQRTLEGSDDVSKFWQVMEFLFNQGQIIEGREFIIQGGLLYARIQYMHPLYLNQMRLNADPHAIPKTTLEEYLKSEDRTFKKKCRKRFGGDNTWAMAFDYEALDISLIRLNEEERKDETAMRLAYSRRGLTPPEFEPESESELITIDDEPF